MDVKAPLKFRWPRVRRQVSTLVIYTVLGAGGLLTIYPLLFSVVGALYEKKAFLFRPSQLLPIPAKPTLENYGMLIFGITEMGTPMLRYALNSIFRTVWLTGWPVLVAFLGGYGFARLRFRGRNVLFWILLGSQVIPGTISIVPLYITMARWPLAGGNNLWGAGGHGLLDSYGPLLLLGMLSIMSIFLVRQSILAGPIELEEAAKIDGCGYLRIIFSIVAPIQKPVIAYLLIVHGIGVWNDWFTPFFFTNSEKYQVLPSIIARIAQQSGRRIFDIIPNFPLILALGIALTIPSLIILAFFQRYIVEGLARIGIKG